MGLLNGLKKVKRYIKLSDGYKLLSIWTSSQSVEMDDGSTLESNKPNWDDKYTKSEVDNKLSAIETNIDWKESVDTFADITSAYPDPQDGWTVNVKDTDYTYRYSGEEWVVISANAIPKDTQSVDGLLKKEDKIRYDSAVTKKHEHMNKSVLDGITSEKVERWDESSTSSVTGVKGNKEENYRSGNVNITPADIGAVDKSGDTMTGALTAPTFHGNLEGTFHGMSDKQIFRGNVEWGLRKPEWTEDVNGWVLPCCYGVSDSCIHLPPNIASPWGNLLVFPSMEGRILQIYYDWNDPNKVYHRAINGTTASNWILFASNAGLDTHINNNNIHFTASERQQLGSLVSQFDNKANAVAPLGCTTLPSNLLSYCSKSGLPYTSNDNYYNLYSSFSDNLNTQFVTAAGTGYRIEKSGYYHLYIRAYMSTCSDVARVKRLGIRVGSITGSWLIMGMGRSQTYDLLNDSGDVHLGAGTILVPVFQMDSNGSTVTTATVDAVMRILPLFVAE